MHQLCEFGAIIVAVTRLWFACTFHNSLTWEADHMVTDKTVTVRTTISGIVNDETLRGRVSATLNTAGGGRSSCSFTRLPTGFTPATLGTHA
jgi:hypothetical protein